MRIGRSTFYDTPDAGARDLTRELWERVQGVLDGRHAKKHRRVKHDFAFSGLIACGHCGCSIVVEGSMLLAFEAD